MRQWVYDAFIQVLMWLQSWAMNALFPALGFGSAVLLKVNSAVQTLLPYMDRAERVIPIADLLSIWLVTVAAVATIRLARYLAGLYPGGLGG